MQLYPVDVMADFITEGLQCIMGVIMSNSSKCEQRSHSQMGFLMEQNGQNLT